MNAKPLFITEGIFYSYDTINGIDCSIGYIKEFRLRWAATQLNTFIFIGETYELIDKKRIEHFSSACMEYAIANNKGWPRGVQSGIASIAIIKGNRVDITAIGFCENPNKKHFSAFEIPTVYDTSTLQGYRYKQIPLWGRIYFPFFTETIDWLFKKIA